MTDPIENLPADQPLLADQPMPRRKFLRRAIKGCFYSGVAVGVYAWRVEPHWIEVVRRPMPIANLPTDLVGRTLVQISDLHVGPVVDNDYLIAAMKTVRNLRPDILAITGDFMTCHGPEQVDAAVKLISHVSPDSFQADGMAHKLLGTVAILGNHDYGRHWQRKEVAAKLASKLEGLGISMLNNSMTEVAGLQIAGTGDLWAGACNVSNTISKIDRAKASLVLTHNPDAVDHLGWNRYQGWILAGHTHGGQCSFPLLGTPLVPIKNYRYTSGMIDLGDGRLLYVNRGLGYSKRIRFRARPEITEFVLERAV